MVYIGLGAEISLPSSTELVLPINNAFQHGLNRR